MRPNTFRLAFALPMLLALCPPAWAAGKTNPTKEFEDWLIPHVDRLIDKDDALWFDDADGHHDVGWIPEERMFWPDGGTGPWPAASVLYTLGRNNPEYERIANQIVLRELDLVHKIIGKLALDDLNGDVAQALAKWSTKKANGADLVKTLPASRFEDFMKRLDNLMEDPEGFDLVYEAGIGLPVLIEGAKNYSGGNSTLVRLECKLVFETMASTVSTLVLAYAYIPSLGGLEALDDLIRGFTGMPALGIVSQMAKFDFAYGQSQRRTLYQALGTAVMDPLQQWTWNQGESRYEGDLWSLPQLLDAVGYAYAYSKKAAYKTRATATFNHLTDHGGWTELYEEVDGQSKSIGGAYEPWRDPGTPDDPSDDYLNPYLSTVWLFQTATVKWYEVLRGSRVAADREMAETHLNHSIAMFRFLQRFMVNPENGIMDHDLRILVAVRGAGRTYVVENRNRAWYPIGCMQCNFAVIRNYLALNKLLNPFGR